jgi:2-methylcitrate dehydratase PrpD
MDFTRELAAFCAGLSLEQIPEEVVHKAKLCVLDYVANVYGSLELEAVRSVVEYIRSLGGPEAATALGCGFKTGIQNAAFLNGTTAEAIEAQDGLRFGGNHPVSAVTPASFAVAESKGLGGREFLEAMVAGYEVACRVAAAVHPFHTLSGFLPTGTCGTFGAAAAASKLMGADRVDMLNALGVAGYLVPLSMAEELMGGYTVKIVQGGQAASAGIMAAGLAGVGITGAPYILEGSELKGGFTQITINGEPNLERLTEGLGERYSINDLYFKPYSACRHTHGSLQAVLELMAEDKLNAEDIEVVEVFTYAISALAVGKGVTPESSFVAAQFSIPYVVAACLIDGELGPRQLTKQRILDPAVIKLSKRVNVQMDEELNKVYPDKTPSRVVVILKSGERHMKQVDIPKGDPRDPMELDDITEKVKSFAGERNAANIDKIVDVVMDFENAGDVRELTEII